jgi:hypothetical protein
MEKLIEESCYSHYQYEIWSYLDDDYPGTKYYYFKILDKGGYQHYWLGCSIIKESDEHYDTLLCAIEGAKEEINELENHEPEPNYDYQRLEINWEERRKMGE